MKLSSECVPCLLKRAAYEVNLCTPDRVMDAIVACSKVAAGGIKEGMSSVEFATKIHERAYDIIGESDPYHDLKVRSNEIALALYPQAERFVKQSEDPLRAAMVVSIVGNILDFGIAGSIGTPESLKKEFKRLMGEALGCDDSTKIIKLIKSAKEIVFLADNCGEIVFDRLLLKQIRAVTDARIVLVIKGEPILTDATKEDIEGLGIEELVDEVLETEGVAVGMDLWTKGMNSALKRRMKGADLIISKGMANFEALSEYKWKAVAYMLRSKCDTVSKALRVEKDISIIKLVRRGAH
jgi:uncharacterized protein with ATP-grasp and redox domains